MAVFISIFALIAILINYLLKRYVIQPVGVLGALAQKISDDENFSADLDSPALELVVARSDELGKLAQVFKHTASVVYERTDKLKRQVQKLVIEIDEMKRNERVKEVVESDFFTDLQKKARQFREKRDEDSDETVDSKNSPE